MSATLLLAGACAAPEPRIDRPVSAGASLEPRGNVALVTEATVIAFWIAAADTLQESARIAAREEFRRSNAMVARYLSDTDIALVATVNDTVVIQLAGGTRRTVMLSGLDFPYGYLLIEPGYAEEFHTGIDTEDDL